MTTRPLTEVVEYFRLHFGIYYGNALSTRTRFKRYRQNTVMAEQYLKRLNINTACVWRGDCLGLYRVGFTGYVEFADGLIRKAVDET